jgi:aminoglycoside phosphotransferase (APT) family kinase protein
MTLDANMAARLTAWLRTRLPDADEVHIEGLDRVKFGHSAEMMMMSVVARHGDQDARQDVVVRLRPKPPALLEPYDLARQFTILRALEDTTVRVPRALWLEDTGEVLGRPFFVMERAVGDVYEMEAPADVADQTVVRMCESLPSNSRLSTRSTSSRPASTRSIAAATTSTVNSSTGPRR